MLLDVTLKGVYCGAFGMTRGCRSHADLFRVFLTISHMRVPAIVRWPAKVRAGVVRNEMLAAVDWLPTLAAMVDACPERS